LQAVISALTGGKFYRLPPDMENPAFLICFKVKHFNTNDLQKTNLFSLQFAIATGYTERALSELLFAKSMGTSPTAT